MGGVRSGNEYGGDREPMDGRHTKGRGQNMWKGWEENAEAISG